MAPSHLIVLLLLKLHILKIWKFKNWIILLVFQKDCLWRHGTVYLHICATFYGFLIFKNLSLGKTYLIEITASIYLFKVNYRNTRTRCEVCSKLTIRITERRYWRRSGIFIVNFEHIWHFDLVFLLLTLNM